MPARSSLTSAVSALAEPSLAKAAAELRARGDRALLIAHQLEQGVSAQSLPTSDKAAFVALANIKLADADTDNAAALSALHRAATNLYASAEKVTAASHTIEKTPPGEILSALGELVSTTPDITVFGPDAGMSVEAGIKSRVALLGAGAAGPTDGNPEVALLLHRATPRDAFKPECSGTLIGAEMIATAAHCVCFDDRGTVVPANACPISLSSRNPDNWLVYFQHAGLVHIKATFPYRRFAISPAKEDAAVIVLAAPVEQIPPVSLPGEFKSHPGDNTMLIGYGASFAQGGNGSSAGLLDPGIKRAGFASLGQCPPGVSSSLTLCWFGNGPHGKVVTCHGDSGGPMEQSSPDTMLVGITSTSSKDCPSIADYENTNLEDLDIQQFLRSPDGGTHLSSATPTAELRQPPANLLPDGMVYDFGPTGTIDVAVPITDKWQGLVISVNTSIPWHGPAQTLTMTVTDASGKPICLIDGGGIITPSVASCRIKNPSPQTLHVSLAGKRKSLAQVIAAAY